MSLTKPFKTHLLERLQTLEARVGYLRAAFKEGDEGTFELAVKYVCESVNFAAPSPDHEKRAQHLMHQFICLAEGAIRQTEQMRKGDRSEAELNLLCKVLEEFDVLVASEFEKHALPELAAALADQPDPAWRPISEAPKSRKLIVGYYNRLGKWRTVLATYYPENTLDASDDSERDYAPEGWYEECEGQETIFPTDKPPIMFQPLPAPPLAAATKETR